MMGKVPGSTTENNQQRAARHVFKGLRTMTDESVQHQTTLLEAVGDVFKQHNLWLNSNEREVLR